MAPLLIAHGKSQGGSTNVTPCYDETIIDTRGATFLFVGCTGGAAHPIGDSFTDSQTNSWTEVPGWSNPGDGHSGNTCQSRYFWCTAPVTSATHAFRMTTVNCGGLNASLIATGWTGIRQALPFTAQTWGASLAPSLGSVVGLAITPLIIGFGDGNTGSNLGTVDGAWTLIDRAASVTDAQDPFVGLNLAYRIVPVSATVTATWTVPGTVVAGKGAGIFAFLGDDTPPVTTTYPIRRLRRFMLPWDDANRMKFLSRLELVMQTGIGDATTTNPTVMLRLSKDGGKTWGNEIQMHAGPVGAFWTRVYANRLGRGRNWVAEVTVSDPSDWQFLQCLIDYDEGVS